jgi:hypothetical protein
MGILRLRYKPEGGAKRENLSLGLRTQFSMESNDKGRIECERPAAAFLRSNGDRGKGPGWT